MLKLFYKLQDMNFGKLMELYAEGNAENAEEFYPDDEKNVAILKVEQAFHQYLREDFFRADGAVYAVWEQGREYISALRLEAYQDGLLLEALETHPEFRRKGYAKALILAVLEHLQQQGSVTVYSHVGKRNTASLRTHLSCGFQRVTEQAVYIDGTVTLHSCTMLFKRPVE